MLKIIRYISNIISLYFICVLTFQINNVLADITIDELDSQPANIRRQRELLGRVPPPALPTLLEVSSECIQGVYGNDNPRVTPRGIRKPTTPITPWAMDGVQSMTPSTEGQTDRNRKSAKVLDIRKEVEVKLRAATAKSRKTEVKTENKPSPYHSI